MNVRTFGGCKQSHDESCLIPVYPSERLCLCQNLIKHVITQIQLPYLIHVIFTGSINVSCRLLCHINHDHNTCKHVVREDAPLKNHVHLFLNCITSRYKFSMCRVYIYSFLLHHDHSVCLGKMIRQAVCSAMWSI